jgi:hypothetical protein
MKSSTKNAGTYLLLLAGLLLLFDSSCAVMRPIPEDGYKTAGPTGNDTYRLMTKDKRVYDFKRFAVTDSTIVILEVESYRAKPYEMDAIKGSIVTPVVIPWDDVKSLERAERSNPMTVVAITAGVVLAGGFVLAVIAAYAVATGLSGLN